MISARLAIAIVLASLSLSGLLGFGQQTEKPTIEVISLPGFGEFAPLRGYINSTRPQKYKLAVVIFIPGLGWYSKSGCISPFDEIRPDGRWNIDTTSGGADQTATRFALYLLPADVKSICLEGAEGIPAELEKQSVAHTVLMRTNAYERTLRFSGYEWGVRSGPVPAGPGPNYFSDSSRNVWLDEQGRMHLRVARNGDQWDCAEVASKMIFGLGTFKFYLDTSPSSLPSNVVFGMFTWSDDSRFTHREMDIELARWGASSGPNAQFVVQPYSLPENLVRFNVPSNLSSSMHMFQWSATSVLFESRGGAGNRTVLHRWIYSGAVPRGDQNARINLWIFDGQPPEGGETEVVLQKFEFVPTTTGPGPRIPAPPTGRAVVGQFYSQRILAIDGTPPYTAWSVSGLSPGLGLDVEKGVILGTPTVEGVFAPMVQVIDSRGVPGSRNIQITVAPSGRR